MDKNFLSEEESKKFFVIVYMPCDSKEKIWFNSNITKLSRASFQKANGNTEGASGISVKNCSCSTCDNTLLLSPGL